MLYYTILYYTILYYTILYYTILYYTILYYTIIEGSIPGDTNLSARAESKAGKYLGLATELKRLYGLKSIKLYDIIGACRTILKWTKNTFKELFDNQGPNAMKSR